MNAKTIGMIFAVFLLTVPLLACAGSGSSGSSGSGSSKSSAVLDLLPDDTSRLEVLKVSEFWAGAQPRPLKSDSRPNGNVTPWATL